MATVDEMIEILMAYKAGKKIQYQSPDRVWIDCSGAPFPLGQTRDPKYRVKPEPRSVWVNEHPGGSVVHLSKEMADKYSGGSLRTVRYVESPE